MASLQSTVLYYSFRMAILTGDKKTHKDRLQLSLVDKFGYFDSVWDSCFTYSETISIPVVNCKVCRNGDYKHDPQSTTGRTSTGRCCHYWSSGGWDGISTRINGNIVLLSRRTFFMFVDAEFLFYWDSRIVGVDNVTSR